MKKPQGKTDLRPLLPMAPPGELGEDERAALQFELRMTVFEQVIDNSRTKKRKKRGKFSEYTTANCEECWGGRPA